MIERMKEINGLLKRAAKSYYVDDTEIMTNYEYDKLYDELVSLEKETGIILNDSMTKQVGTEVVSKLKKKEHEYPALSLDKTKDVGTLKQWLGNQNGILSWKLDGLTVVMTYDNGALQSVVTRGNGVIGEDITHNAKFFGGVPKYIDYKGHLVVRGEALMTYSEFNRINENLNEEEQFKNPRNLASGTVRALDPSVAKERHINVKLFEVVYGYTKSPEHFSDKMEWAKSLGFDTVEYKRVNAENIEDTVIWFKEKISDNDFPSDGLVLTYEDIKYGVSLGTTGKFPKWSIAFKWTDETKETTLRELFWSASRTGRINPVAVFDPIELEGTTVKRASASNVSIAKSLQLGVGSTLSIYKANMIIPTIAENRNPVGEVYIPDKCPICGMETEIRKSKDGIETLYCTNEKCPAKNIGMFERFCCRDAMNIIGISESTFEKFISYGYLHELGDIYNLSKYKDQIIELDGFGEKSYNNIIESIENSRTVPFSRFLYSIGIPNIGRDASKKISQYIHGSLDKFNELCDNEFDFTAIPDVGAIMNASIHNYMDNLIDGDTWYTRLLKEINVTEEFESKEKNSFIFGKTFVITGSLYTYKNRDALKELIESLNGKVSGSVSLKTDYLINNNVASTSGKNKKANELGIKIISEEEFNNMIKPD